MGGQAFSNTGDDSPINCPRMPPDVYNSVATEIQSKLEILFNKVTIPREAPGKADYGDIDFLVADEKPHEDLQPQYQSKSVWLRIAAIIAAEYHLHHGWSHSYAIDHPVIPNAYVQVDVEISPGVGTPDSHELFEWTRFMKSDADLLQIIGICHRPLGLTCNDKGLHLRVEEIEPYNKKKSLLFLTRKPDEVMKFYGFDAVKYWTGFETEKELFDWVSQGRFFSRDVFAHRTEKSNDRARQNKRPMYRRFVEEYMHSYPEIETSTLTRADVLEMALDMFNKREEYQAMMGEHNWKEADAQLWKEIRELVPLEGHALGIALRGLNRWVIFKDGQPQIASEPMIEPKDQPVRVQATLSVGREQLLAWIRDNWAEVEALEKARVPYLTTKDLSLGYTDDLTIYPRGQKD
ncbi:hypothetical protein K505DRAFT_327132 [Melanomma pulvis-pyrius CBS 109.77]|uniref:Uncharacterized protein n=1 Tax=Melanomma pulvis-pyrius CBS 109.77 TaxID=1314802 RepID=A0A6A6X4C6_9PLEO|nr:hypothetical protein K505DRAFT_327132 [Melanomma pulvis-pyrius CBS 109.77]